MAMNKRKTTTAVVAGVAAVALILGGTFAWTSISQEAKNETIVDINPGGRLHDDFNGTNKDVYVENFGDNETGVPIFARIRLDEYMEVGPDAGINKNDPDRSVTVLYPDGETEPKINDTSTWITYKPGDSIDTNPAVENKDRKYGYYWDWSLGNDDQNLPYYMPTFNKNKDSLKADINGTYEGNITGDALHYDDYVAYKDGDSATKDATYDWDEDTVEDYVDETRDENTPFDTVDVLKKQETHKATKISTTAEVITMAEWLAPVVDGGKGGARGDFWVYDEDGWAYWANPIEPGKTTGLLLDGINMSRTPGDNWYYGINVVAQFATASDLGMFAAPTDNAKELLKVISVDETIKAILTANGQTVDDGTGTQVPAYTLSFVNDRETYTADDVATTAEGLEVTPIATYNGADIVAVFDDLVGRKEYEGGAEIPWYDYRTSITAASIDTEMAPEMTKMWFYNMSNLTSVEGLANINTENTTKIALMFFGCSKLTELDGIEGWNVSNVTDMAGFVQNCSSLLSLDLSKWDTSSTTNMGGMFMNCSSLTSLDVSGWDTADVTNMANMFSYCSSLTDENFKGVSDFNVSSVVQMYSMFAYCNNENFTTLDLSGTGWDTSKVTRMDAMFNGCTNLTSLDLTGWDTSSATTMLNMFNSCTNLATINGIEDFKTDNVTNMQSVFYNCGITGSLDLSGWKTGNVTTMNSMFRGCKNLTSIDFTGWDTGKVTNMSGLLMQCTSLGTITGISDWNVSSVTNMQSTFHGIAVTDLDLSDWDTSSLTNMESMFRGCPNLQTLTLGEKWNTSNVTNMKHVFADSTNLTLDCSKWDVGKVTDHTGFATNASKVTLPDAWTTAYALLTQNVDGTTYTMTFMRAETAPTEGGTYNGETIAKVFADFEANQYSESSMPWYNYRASITSVEITGNLYPVSTASWFYNMGNLTTVNGLEKIDTSNTTSLHNMFSRCYKLEKLEGISDWNTSNVTDMRGAFFGIAVTELDLSGWDTSSVTSMYRSFTNCTNLTKLTLGTGWNTGNVNDMVEMFQACSSLTLDCSGWDVTNVTDYTNFSAISDTDATLIGTITPPTWVN